VRAYRRRQYPERAVGDKLIDNGQRTVGGHEDTTDGCCGIIRAAPAIVSIAWRYQTGRNGAAVPPEVRT
jgi:hypothetical protein